MSLRDLPAHPPGYGGTRKSGMNLPVVKIDRRAQMESCVGYGLGATLSGAITLKDGVVEQDNFDTYTVLRHAQMPRVEVHIVPSREAPTGVGEPGVPPLAPALANALFAATGKRYRRLPFSLGPDAA